MKYTSFIVALCLASPLSAQTIKEKKESFQLSNTHHEIQKEDVKSLHFVNELLEQKHFDLNNLYEGVWQLFSKGGDEEAFRSLWLRIKELKKEIADIQEMWRREASSFGQLEEYALWHQPEATLTQLVIDYGSMDYLYLIPPDIGMLRCSLLSNLPVPRESWNECLELILSQFGVGVKQLNPFIKELYYLRSDLSGIKGVVNKIDELDLFSGQSRVCFILTPSAQDPRTALHMLQKFSNMNTTDLEILAGKIFITGSVESIQELLKLYSFIEKENGMQECQLVQLNSLKAVEMQTILNTAFHQGEPSFDGSSLKVVLLEHSDHALFLTGTKDEVKKGEKLIREIESQVRDPLEKTVYWYTVRHSDAAELAAVLAKVYDLLKGLSVGGDKVTTVQEMGERENALIVEAAQVHPTSPPQKKLQTADGLNNFIVDPKSGAIIMVVEKEALPKIKELLKKLDVPKKMVQIEVLLFEKKVTNQSRVGINLLRLGSEATNIAKTGLTFGTSKVASGITEFFMSHTKGSGIPAYDLAYQFLLGQEDVQINASPSITTMNQTPATIAIVEEISIDQGANEKNNHLFNRAQYGITIQLTPTINQEEEEESDGFITLETDITFDTTKNSYNNRPDVTRRHIKNHVRIPDGQTVILGGLRRKNAQDNRDSIPFLGEIPGIGKLFSSTEMSDSSTEMFVFITPKIIEDPIHNAAKLAAEELTRRPGDIPEFLMASAAAKKTQKQRLFEKSLTALFGKMGAFNEPELTPTGEYDGR